LCHRSSQTN